MGFEVSCCDINPSFFSIPDLKMDIGDLNQSLPYADESFDYLICLIGGRYGSWDRGLARTAPSRCSYLVIDRERSS
jgi:hypothetical protein